MKKITLSFLLPITALFICPSEAVAERAFFRSPPTKISIHNPESTAHQRNRTTISVLVPDNAGRSLQGMVLSQIRGIDVWDWGHQQPELYIGNYGVHQRGRLGLATASVSEEGHDLTVHFDQAIEPGQQVNLVFRGINPKADIYLWSTLLVPAGKRPLLSSGKTLRLQLYRPDYLH
jgi:hypothetical protein